MKDAQPTPCALCGSAAEPFLQIGSVPTTCSRSYDSRQDALSAPRGDICLVHCNECDYVFNVSFEADREPPESTQDASLHVSPGFRASTEKLALRLSRKYSLSAKKALELLSLPYSNPQGKNTHRDLIVCRNVLQRIARPLDFLAQIRNEAERNRTPVFFEVPNALYALRGGGVWDFTYEHRSYFTPSSLRHVFGRAGFDVDEIEEIFDGQHLAVHASPGRNGASAPPAEGVEDRAPRLARFAEVFQMRLEAAISLLDGCLSGRQRAVLWGSGSVGTTFLNLIGAGAGIEYALDTDPRRQGKFVAGSGTAIVAPQFLRRHRDSIVVLTSPALANDAQHTLKTAGCTAELARV